MAPQARWCLAVLGLLPCAAARRDLRRQGGDAADAAEPAPGDASPTHSHVLPVAAAFLDLHVAGQGQSSPAAQARRPAAEREGIFCYALARTPPEETVPLWKEAASKACDGSALFAHEGNASLGIIQAYTVKQEQHGWAHQQQDMTVYGAWRHLAETGELWKYKWVVKLDTDSYVRPSTFKRNLLAHDPTRFGVVSCGGKGGTVVEGWLVALSAATIDALYDGIQSGFHTCLPNQMYEMASGHNSETLAPSLMTADKNCLQKKFGFDICRDTQRFEDAEGSVLTAQPQNPQRSPEDPAVPPMCRETFQLSVLDFATSSGATEGASQEQSALTEQGVPTRKKSGFCGCKPGGATDRACISRDVAIVHPVKDAALYRRFLDSLP